MPALWTKTSNMHIMEIDATGLKLNLTLIAEIKVRMVNINKVATFTIKKESSIIVLTYLNLLYIIISFIHYIL
jgi:hypothetical protein